MSEAKPFPPAQCYGPNGWYQLDPDPLDAVIAEDGDWDEGFEALGFERWSWVGEEERPSVPFVLTVQRRQSGRPQFKVEITTNVGGVFDYVYADDLPSLMRLLSEWAPAMQAAALIQIASMFPTGKPAAELPTLDALLRSAGKDGLEKVADKVDDVRRAVHLVEERLESVESGLERELGNLARAVG